MKNFNFVLVAMMLAILCCSLGGCAAAGTATKPYDGLNLQVTVDDDGVKAVVVLLQTGLVPVQYHTYAMGLYTAKELFVNNVVPIEEAAAVRSAAAVLDPGAVTKAALDANIVALKSDLDSLHLASAKAIPDVVVEGVQARAAAASKQPPAK